MSRWGTPSSGNGHAVEQVARLDQRDVERAAVERDQRAVLARERGHVGQQRAFVLEARHDELPDANRRALEERASHEKRLRAGAAGEARGLEVEEQ